MLRDGVAPLVECDFSSQSFGTKSSLDSWSVFLQDGVTLFGSGSHYLISSEGIPRVGLMEAFFLCCPRDVFCHPLVARSALKPGRVPYSDVFASSEDSVCTPLANEGVGVDPSSSSGPVASRPPQVDRSASAASLVFHAWWLASSTSGSRTSRKGLLAYCQGASDSLPHPSPGCEVKASVFGIAVRTLLQATSLTRCMESSPEPGQGLSISAFKGCNSVLKAFSF